MDICISSFSFGNAFKNNLLNALDFPAFCKSEFGVTQVEFFDADFFHDRDKVVHSIQELTPDGDYVRKVREACRSAGVSIVAIAAQNDFTNPDDEQRQADMDRVRKWIDIAAAVGAGVIRINSGNHFADPDGGGRKRLLESLRQLGPAAKARNITLAIENHPIELASVDEAKSLAGIAAELREYGVATCPDSGHIEPQVWREALEALFDRGRARHCHAEFYEFTDEGEESTIDYAAFFSIVRTKNYAGVFSVEVIPPATAAGPVSYRIAEDALKRMSEQGVPATATSKVRPLAAGRFLSIAALDAAVASNLHAPEVREFRETIRRCAEQLNPDFEMRKGAVRRAIQVLQRHGAPS